MITGVHKVVVPVQDQLASKAFWVDAMGFQLIADLPYGESHWIEVAPANDALVLILSPRGDEPRRKVDDRLPHSPLFFNCADIHQTYAELCNRGVIFPAPPVQMPFGWWSMFEDNEGSRYVLGQW